jgi:hypothetical protein
VISHTAHGRRIPCAGRGRSPSRCATSHGDRSGARAGQVSAGWPTSSRARQTKEGRPNRWTSGAALARDEEPTDPDPAAAASSSHCARSKARLRITPTSRTRSWRASRSGTGKRHRAAGRRTGPAAPQTLLQTLPYTTLRAGRSARITVTREPGPTCSASVADRTRAQPQSSWRRPPDPRCAAAAQRVSRRPCSRA